MTCIDNTKVHLKILIKEKDPGVLFDAKFQF